MLALNLKGPFRLSALVAARMAKGEGGSIINISSGAAVHPLPGIAVYAATKAGLNAITRIFALEFGPRVRVNAIMPGTFRTAMLGAGDEGAIAGLGAKAIARDGDPQEIVTTALYLASPASSYTTGAVISVDGGQA
jgi:NAD(P)-dependent dehydrogenase (short-subunit alcohol dehydrogenase family)